MKKIDIAQLKGKLRFTNKNEDNFTEEENNSCVNQIINIMVQDNDINSPRRVATLSQEIQDCYRGQKESYGLFFERFLSLAEYYLIISHEEDVGRDNQILSLFLLKNVRLLLSVYDMIMTCFITDARANAGHMQKELQYSDETVKVIISNINEEKLAIEYLIVSEEESKLINSEKLDGKLNAIESILRDTLPCYSDSIEAENTPEPINLYKAIDTIKNIHFYEDKIAPENAKNVPKTESAASTSQVDTQTCSAYML